MKFKLGLLFLFIFSSPVFAQFPGWAWAETNAGGNADCATRSVATDNAGNIYVVGGFGVSTLTFGNTTLTCAGSGDILLIKYAPDGHVIWAKNAGGGSFQTGYNIAIDHNANIYISGIFRASVIIGPNTCFNSDSTTFDVFIAKFDSTGSPQWVRSAGGTGEEYDTGLSIDAADNLYLTGYFNSSSITFGSTVLSNSSNLEKFFIAKYDPAGNSIWAKGSVGSGEAETECITVGKDGNVYITGTFYGTLIFGSSTITVNGNSTVFLAKYDTSGIALWGTRPSGSITTNGDRGKAIYADADGNVYVCGNFTSMCLYFGSTPLYESVGNMGNMDMFLARYDSIGNAVWARSFGEGHGDESPENLAMDSSGNIYMAGWFYSDHIYFDTTFTITLYNCCSGGTGLFIAKFDSSGTTIWAKNEDNMISGWDEADGITSDNNGNIYLTGFFTAAPISLGTNLPITGGTSMYLAKIGTPAGVEEETNQFTSLIFPNPFSISSTLKIENHKVHNATLSIYDISGKSVRTITSINSNNIEIDKGNLEDGIYFYRLTNGEGEISSGKFIIGEY
jgi:hypothetical protein